MKVIVFSEFNFSMLTEEGVKAYPETLGVCLKELFSEGGNDVTLVKLDENGEEDFDQNKAKEVVKDFLKVDSVNKAYVEKNGQFYLCYEVSGWAGDDQYFVYLEKDSLKEIQIFKVIKGTEGYTVM